MALNSLFGIKPNLKQVEVEVDEISPGDTIIVREMSTRRFSMYQKAIKENPEFPVEHLLVACMVNEDGGQIATHEDVLSISEMMPVEVSNRLMDACREVNASLFKTADSKKSNSQLKL